MVENYKKKTKLDYFADVCESIVPLNNNNDVIDEIEVLYNIYKKKTKCRGNTKNIEKFLKEIRKCLFKGEMKYGMENSKTFAENEQRRRMSLTISLNAISDLLDNKFKRNKVNIVINALKFILIAQISKNYQFK